MSKVIRIGDVSIPLDSYVVGGTALLGIRESGKSFAAKGIAEQLLDHDIPIVVFDAIGVWRFLKVARPSSGGRGFKVVVAGGEGADLPLTPASAPAIVRAAIVENIPLVIDLYDPKLSKADWRRIVQHCFRTLLYENKGLRHIFLEETAEYAPQKVMDGETYAEVEKLVRMGGNKSLGITLINQRAQEVNKAVLDLCENLVLMRQRGAHAIEALEKWIDKLEPDVAKQIAAEMPRMGQGDAWVFSGSADAAKRTHTALIHSYHPDRRKPQTRETSPDRIADTADFVAKLAGELKTLTAQAEANDPKMLRKRIADLEQQLRAKPGAAPAASREDLKAAEQRGAQRERQLIVRDLTQWQKGLRGQLHKAFDAALLQIRLPESLGQAPGAVATVTVHPQTPRSSATNRALAEVVKVAAKHIGNGHAVPQGDLSGPEQRIVDAIAWLESLGIDPCEQTAVAFLANYTYGGGAFNNPRGRLNQRGLVEYVGGDKIRLTDAGRELANAPESALTPEELHARVLARLPGPEQRLLRPLLDAHPNPMSGEDLAAAANYTHGVGAFNNPRGRLKSLGLIEYLGGGQIRAADALFPGRA